MKEKKILLPELNPRERPEFNSWYFRVLVLLKGVSPKQAQIILLHKLQLWPAASEPLESPAVSTTVRLSVPNLVQMKESEN